MQTLQIFLSLMVKIVRTAKSWDVRKCDRSLRDSQLDIFVGMITKHFWYDNCRGYRNNTCFASVLLTAPGMHTRNTPPPPQSDFLFGKDLFFSLLMSNLSLIYPISPEQRELFIPATKCFIPQERFASIKELFILVLLELFIPTKEQFIPATEILYLPTRLGQVSVRELFLYRQESYFYDKEISIHPTKRATFR